MGAFCCGSRDGPDLDHWRLRIDEASTRLGPYIKETRVLEHPGRPNVYLKLESEQVTGSFKARGGGNKLLKVSQATRANGIVAASTGNHGCGVANMAQQL